MIENQSRSKKINIFRNLNRLRKLNKFKKSNNLKNHKKCLKIMITKIITEVIHQLIPKTTITANTTETTTKSACSNHQSGIIHLRPNLRLPLAQAIQICLLRIFWIGCLQLTNTLSKIVLKPALSLWWSSLSFSQLFSWFVSNSINKSCAPD